MTPSYRTAPAGVRIDVLGNARCWRLAGRRP